MRSKTRVLNALLAASACCLCFDSSGSSQQAQVASSSADPLPPASAFAFACEIHSLANGDADSFLVVAHARNVSNAPLALCCRFDFEGSFAATVPCAAERSPIFYLLARSTAPETRLDCRAIVLAPGAAYSDSASFELHRPDFTRCPGTIDIRGSFWVGRPGSTFAESKLLVQDAVRVSAREPAAP